MIKLIRAWWLFCIAGLCFGGSSSSAATTNNVDKRLVTGQGMGISADNSTVNVLDGGAIAQAIDLVKTTDANAGKNYAQTLGLAKDFFTQSVAALDKSAAMVKDSGAVVAAAYDNAKGQGADAKFMAYGAMAVVALVAVKSFGK